jgi:spore coat protein CotH
MAMRSRLLLLCTTAFSLACSGDHTPSSSAGNTDTKSEPTESERKREAATAMFAEDQVRTFNLILSEENLEAINADPTAEQWVEGTLDMDGDTAQRVGIRYKGSEGAWYGCVQGGPWGGGRKICPLNMKVKIDYKDDTTFHGLKTLQFHAMTDHPAKLTETVAYWFVRQMGIASPRTAYCKLFINGQFEGLYLNVEEMDSRFVDAWQPGSDANLFKEVWPLSWDSTATTEQAMVDGLRTNEKKPDVASFRAFALELEAAADPAAVRAAIEKWMDVEQALSVAALRLALDDDDGAFHWYALDASSANAARPHNFYWMEDPASGKFQLLPWDLDKSFTLVADPDTSNAIEILDAWGATSHDCQNYGSGWPQRSAACDKLVAGLASYNDVYRAKLQATLDGPFTKVDSLVATWTTRLEPVIASLPTTNGQGITITNWKEGVTNLQQEIAKSRTIVADAVAAP